MMVDMTQEIIDKLHEYGFKSTRVDAYHFSRKKGGNVEFVDLRFNEPRIDVVIDGQNVSHTPYDLEPSDECKQLKEELEKMVE